MVFPGVKTHWWKVRVNFDRQSACDNEALRCALQLRLNFPLIYYARYNSDKHYVEYTVMCKGAKGVPREQIKIMRTISDTIMGGTLVPKFTVDKPVECDGSEAHGHAFDAVCAILGARNLTTDDDRKAALADLIHWMHNMAGIDYLDEARQALYTMGRILDMIQPVAAKTRA